MSLRNKTCFCGFAIKKKANFYEPNKRTFLGFVAEKGNKISIYRLFLPMI